MILNQQRPTRRGLVLVLTIAGVAMGSTALAVQGFAADRRISATEVQRIADRCLAPEGIHLNFNDHAVENVNKAVTAGRKFFQNGSNRLELYRPVGAAALAKHDVPNALLAIPIIESGVGESYACQCDEDSAAGDLGPRGIWQMIRTTALAYGLRVDAGVDERFAPDREADAAARLLSDLHRTFSDWPLAIAAYNAGPAKIKDAIRAGGTRDVLELQRKGLLNPYLFSDVIPAMILLCAPELIAE